ncbi:MFS transporter [Marinomonas fungiae]|uniref:MFS transporter n=1 Tax=Marinomonas fungiae TaxID=1137284 RepID=UPI003A911838
MSTTKHPWAMLASVYITQYIGIAFIISSAVAILRQKGVPLDQLAMLNLAFLPLMGKVFYAPIIDQYRFVLQGTYRSWLVLAQGAMTVLLLIAGTMNTESQFISILIVLGIYVFFMSLQDVAIDGLACKLFDGHSRKFANSIQFSGNLLGNIVGGGIILMLYPWLDWHGSLTILAALTLISLLQIVFFKEPANNAIATTPLSAHLWPALLQFLKQNKSWFVVMCLYPIGSTCGFALLNPLLVDSGWALNEIGFATKIYGSCIGLLSALFATPLITWLGRLKALTSIIFIQAIALLLLIPVTQGQTGSLMVYSYITAHFIGFPALLVISSTIMMDKAADTHHKATFFTLQFSVASLLGLAYSSVSMTLANQYGYNNIVMYGATLTAGIMVFVWFALRRMHSLEADHPPLEHSPSQA